MRHRIHKLDDWLQHQASGWSYQAPDGVDSSSYFSKHNIYGVPLSNGKLLYIFSSRKVER